MQDELAANGWQSQAIDMPSAGVQRNPTAGLYDDAEELAARLRLMAGPVVLVGRSHSGLTISQLADDHPNVLRLVCVAAFMPTEGESAASIFGIPVPDDLSGFAPALPDPRMSLYGDLSDDDAARALSRLVDQSLRSFCQPTCPPLADWRRS